MNKIFFLAFIVFASCTNSPAPTTTNTSDSATAFKWPAEDENEFLLECVENAQLRLREDSAYMYCRCVLQQIKQKFPNMDSASVALADTARAAEFVKKCD